MVIASGYGKPELEQTLMTWMTITYPKIEEFAIGILRTDTMAAKTDWLKVPYLLCIYQVR